MLFISIYMYNYKPTLVHRSQIIIMIIIIIKISKWHAVCTEQKNSLYFCPISNVLNGSFVWFWISFMRRHTERGRVNRKYANANEKQNNNVFNTKTPSFVHRNKKNSFPLIFPKLLNVLSSHRAAVSLLSTMVLKKWFFLYPKWKHSGIIYAHLFCSWAFSLFAWSFFSLFFILLHFPALEIRQLKQHVVNVPKTK